MHPLDKFTPEVAALLKELRESNGLYLKGDALQQFRRYAGEWLHRYAAVRHARCLTVGSILNTRQKHQFICQNNHAFELNLPALSAGTWCRACFVASRKDSMEMINAFVAKRGGRCLSTEYTASNVKYTFECSRGHQWAATWQAIKGGGWCRKCFADNLRGNLEEIQNFVAQRGWRCHSTEYVNAYTHYEFECQHGHRWFAKWDNIQQLKGCPECHRLTQINSFETILERIHAMGGECLSPASDYRNSHSKLKVRCARGHEFLRGVQGLSAGKWCRKCAFEDKRKYTVTDLQQYAAKRRGQCLSPAFISTNHEYDWMCELGHVFKRNWAYVQQQWCSECFHQAQRIEAWERLNDIVKRKGGVCIDSIQSFENARSKLWVRCNKGHHFRTNATYLEVGTWCAKCHHARMRRYSLVDLHQFAHKKGGKCHSQKYTNIDHTYEWECIEGHRWSASWFNLYRLKEWCPTCRAIEEEAKKRETIRRLHVK